MKLLRNLYCLCLLVSVTSAASGQLYIPGTAQAVTNGTTANVGVGTSTPEGKFTISQIGNGWFDGLRINRDASNFLTLTEDVSDIRLKNWGTGGIFFYTSSGLVTILNNGNLGVGTAAPSAPLEVRAANNALGTIRVNTLTSGEYSSFGLYENNVKRWALYNHPGQANNLVFANKDNHDKIFFSQDGKIGVGASPQAPIHAVGAPGEVLRLSMPNTYVANAGPELVFWNGTSEDLASIAGVFKDSNQGNYGNLVFKTRTNDQVRLETKMIIQSNGNVGIGTTEPCSFKLAVNGKIWSQEVNIAMTNPGPDYVFEKDYNLLSLEALEAYIEANKHLPEVPSAKQMDAEGLNLKEMNLILLKKVEELTLHLIEANKKIEETNQKVQALEKKVARNQN